LDLEWGWHCCVSCGGDHEALQLLAARLWRLTGQEAWDIQEKPSGCKKFPPPDVVGSSMAGKGADGACPRLCTFLRHFDFGSSCCSASSALPVHRWNSFRMSLCDCGCFSVTEIYLPICS
jgi:hypothetical protein